jgi:hypothetical protein
MATMNNGQPTSDEQRENGLQVLRAPCSQHGLGARISGRNRNSGHANTGSPFPSTYDNNIRSCCLRLRYSRQHHSQSKHR